MKKPSQTQAQVSSAVGSIIESLEPRLAPAGMVTLAISGGVLTITGDTADNFIIITDLPTQQEPGANPQPGVSSWQISGGDSEQFKFNGATFTGSVTIAAQNGIKADLKDGDDTLYIFASQAPESGMVLSGGLTVLGGKGNDELGLGDLANSQLVIGGATMIDMGDGDDEIYTDSSVTFGGAVTIKTGAGADDVIMNGGQLVFQKGLSVDLGAGEDEMRVASTRFDVLGALSIKGAGEATKTQKVLLGPSEGHIEGATTVAFVAGRLELTVGALLGQAQSFNSSFSVTVTNGINIVILKGAVTVGGALTVAVKNGGSLLRLDQDSTLYAGSVTMKGGSGEDMFDVVNGSTLHSGAGLTLSLGDGQNLVTVGTMTNIQAGGSFVYTGGAGQDQVLLQGTVLNVLGNMTLNLGAGQNVMSATEGTVVTANALTWTGGKDMDYLTLLDADLNLRGSLTLAMGEGTNDWVTTDGAEVTAAALTYTGGKGDDTVNVGGSLLHVAGNLTLGLGAGTNTSMLAPTVSLFADGNLTIKGGAGSEIVTLGSAALRVMGNTTLALGDGLNQALLSGEALKLVGNLTYTGGTGDDMLDSTATSLVVGRAVALNMGDGVNSVLFRPGSGTLGAVTYKGGTGGDGLVLGHQNGMNTSLLTISGSVSAVMGAGTAVLHLTDVLLQGALTAVMAGKTGEADTVTLRQSTFNGPVNITQGAGDSTLSVHDSFMRGNFTAKLGAGADTLNLDTAEGTTMPNVWMGTLNVNMGTGVDTINIGSATNEAGMLNIFYRLATIVTGPEADVYVPHGNHTFYAGADLRVLDV